MWGYQLTCSLRSAVTADSWIQRETLGFHILEKEGTGNRRGRYIGPEKTVGSQQVPEG